MRPLLSFALHLLLSELRLRLPVSQLEFQSHL
jgi:hypothetical protein